MNLSDDLRDISATFIDGDWYGTHPDYPAVKGSSYDDALQRMQHFVQDLWLDLEPLEDCEDYDGEGT